MASLVVKTCEIEQKERMRCEVSKNSMQADSASIERGRAEVLVRPELRRLHDAKRTIRGIAWRHGHPTVAA